MDNVRILISSDPRYDKLVAEIYIDENFSGLISQDSGSFRYDIPPANEAQGMAKSVDFDVFVKALSAARKRLTGEV